MTLFVSFSVFATKNIELDEDELLLTSCQALMVTPEQENSKACIYFIPGFLAAAKLLILQSSTQLPPPPQFDTTKRLKDMIFKALKAEYPC